MEHGDCAFPAPAASDVEEEEEARKGLEPLFRIDDRALLLTLKRERRPERDWNIPADFVPPPTIGKVEEGAEAQKGLELQTIHVERNIFFKLKRERRPVRDWNFLGSLIKQIIAICVEEGESARQGLEPPRLPAVCRKGYVVEEGEEARKGLEQSDTVLEETAPFIEEQVSPRSGLELREFLCTRRTGLSVIEELGAETGSHGRRKGRRSIHKVC